VQARRGLDSHGMPGSGYRRRGIPAVSKQGLRGGSRLTEEGRGYTLLQEPPRSLLQAFNSKLDQPSTTLGLRLLRVCHQVYVEANPVLWGLVCKRPPRAATSLTKRVAFRLRESSLTPNPSSFVPHPASRSCEAIESPGFCVKI
jgi:ribosomal protein L30/L7E